MTRSESFTVKARSSSPAGITLKVRGDIDGTAKAYIHDYSKVALSGSVNSSVYRDGFEQDCTIHFEPGTATTGSSEISYAFDWSKSALPDTP